MAKNPEKFLKRLLRDNEIQRRVRNAMLILSLFVTLGVFWNLKLTGITMAGEAFCGKEEHVHGPDCPTGILTCTLVESEPHVHSEACIHRELICTEEEREGHVHTSACEKRELLCVEAGREGHVHSASCENWVLICGEQERQTHIHGQDCWHNTLVCSLQESEGHTHGSGCRQLDLTCGLEEDENHAHGEGCYTERLICEIPEGEPHTHEEGCWEKQLVCTQEEVIGHTHEESCYRLEPGYSCGIHVHTDSCYGKVKQIICGLEVDPGHIHGDECYQMGIGFGCGKTEAEGHVHSQECITGETEIDCGKEANEGHIHTDLCYETCDQCPLEAHIHDENCYSDIQADLETEDDWEMSLAGLSRSILTSENVVAVATSQLGNGESTRNFLVDEFGVRRGITRYGQWYGNPYGDWSGMFASFCLYYAGVQDVPSNAGPEAMRLEWAELGYYAEAEAFSPRYGDLLFLHLEKETVEAAAENPEEAEEFQETEEPQETEQQQVREKPPANAVAIITGFDGENILVIQGDLNGVVGETAYPANDPAVLGYGMVPDDMSYAILVPPPEGAKVIAQTSSYNTNNFNNNNRFVLYTTVNGADYAIDGAGNAVLIYVDGGQIYTDLEDPKQLLWTFTKANGNNNYSIQNMATGRFLHAYNNNASDNGVTTVGSYASNVTNNNSGALIKSNSYYARLDTESGKFVPTNNQSQAVRYKLGMSTPYTVWLDGTCGGQAQHGGSLNQKYTVNFGDTIIMPDEWQVPKKYGQSLRGWYDVTNHTYYACGEEVTVTGNMVFYADWVAASYDFGTFNSSVSDTVSTNSFITTHVFDYNYLFNVMSANPTIEVSSSSHSETWRFVADGTVDYRNQESLGFVFVDYDGSSRLPDMSGRDDNNNYHGVGIITQGIYSPERTEVLFGKGNALNPATGEGVIGKTYLGTGDHLFQFMDDISDPHYGYYYYDSTRNAASYNHSQQRFYVYDYLEATSDSLNSDAKSDFLPFNSPYANTNGNTVRTYTYAGDHGEYSDTTHYRYDSKYSDSNNGEDYVHTNYAFGMYMQVEFFLPNVPGAQIDGEYGNKDLFGNDMHFQFKGDDDVWVLVDNKLVLDLGGIHGIEAGDINFSTGTVTINGTVDEELSTTLKTVTAGEHILNVYYLERGSSQSNCAFYFNLAPRFSLSIQKEDVLTQELLNGAKFAVFQDRDCTKPAELWESEAAHDAGQAATNEFTVAGGVANMWGFASGNTYYIKETKSPDAEAYKDNLVNGIIRLTIDKNGIASYDVEILAEEGNGVSPGFTVHGIKIDQETQRAYIVATNAPKWVKEVTTVQVMKRWNDNKDHSGDHLTAYLTVTDADGTVRRIREVYLGPENDWRYTWTNLPKFAADGVTPIQYGVQESYVPGYQGQVQKVDQYTFVEEDWAEAYGLLNNQTYVIRSSSGYLSTTGAGADTGYKWVSEETAKSSQYALWTAHANSSGKAFKLTNGAGQTITFYYANGNPTDFYSSTGGENSNSVQYFSVGTANNGIRLFYDASNGRDYYMTSSMNSSGKFGYDTNQNNGMVLVPMTKMEKTYTETITGWGYQITNTPLTEETAVEVRKEWYNPAGDDPTLYQTEQVTIRLLANGVFTGRTVTLNLKNGWRDTFLGLPAKDEAGNYIHYTVEEIWSTDDWIPDYGEIITIGTQKPTYTTTVTNIYRVGGPILPSTGSPARLLYILCGAGIMLSSLVCGLISRRKRERRRN